jgi:hypothetical protein
MTRYVKIDYAKPPPWHRRLWVRWVLLLIAIVLISPVALRLGRFSVARWQVHRLYAQCAGYVAPAEMVIYDEDPAGYARLSKLPQYSTVGSLDSPAAYFVLPEWRRFCAGAGAGQIQSYGTLFVGELRTPTGKRRLVGADITGWFRGGISPVLSIHARAFESRPAMLLPPQTDSKTFNLALGHSEGVLRISAGQRDPKDASHFTITYTVAGSEGIIDGWLKDDGSVLMETR